MDEQCIPPRNPYRYGTGHYAGYEWGVDNEEEADGYSPSFNEGCAEFLRQKQEYEDCLEREKEAERLRIVEGEADKNKPLGDKW